MKFLPRPSSLLLLTVAVSLTACATAANRRALYFPAKPGGVWHDYETRRLAEQEAGISTTAYTSTTTTATTLPPTKLPPSRPVHGGADIAAPPSSSGIPAPGSATPAENGLPQAPAPAPTDATAPAPVPPVQ